MDAALTLGAGTLTAAMLSGATFGYKTVWLLWVSMGLGLFMMAAMARFTTRGLGVIALQDRYHGWVIGSLMTALIGTTGVAIVFNWGQVSLGTYLMELLADRLGYTFPQQWNWIVYVALTSWLTLSYGRKGRRGIRFIENSSKIRTRFDLPKHLVAIRSRQVEIEQNYPRSRSFASVGVLSPMIQVVECAVSIRAPVDAVVDARFAKGTNDGFFVLRAVLDEEDHLRQRLE